MAASTLPVPANSKPSFSQSHNNRSSSLATYSTSSIRFHVAKMIRRAFRTCRTELRLFLLRPMHRRPWTIPLLLLLFSTIVVLLLYSILFPIVAPIHTFYGKHGETHFTRVSHAMLPKPETFDTVRARPCSWLYLEFGVKDGRHLDGFFTNGNHFMEEFLRGSQSAMRAFCAIAFEPDSGLKQALQAVREKRGRRSKSFDIFTQFVPGAKEATEMIKFRRLDTGQIPDEEMPVTSIPLKQFIRNVTFPLNESGNDVPQMVTANGNGNIGTVVVRFNDLSAPQALWYLDLLEANDVNGVLCTRIDRLVLDFEKIQLDIDSLKGNVKNRVAVRDWARITTSPSSRLFSPTDDINSVINLAKEINKKQGCRAMVHILDHAGKMIVPTLLQQDAVMYAILAGEPTFNERVHAQSHTWMQAVPRNRIKIYTNVERSARDLKAADGYDVGIVHPYRPEIEQHLNLMQSWSHLVRVRESWDSTMRDNENIQWLVLVDDDTFVFPGGMREYLSSFDPRLLVWGGSGEQARVDNGDAGQFALWLRRTHQKNGGEYCYLKNEFIPKQFRTVKMEYFFSEVLNGKRVAKRISKLCEDTFCLRGCPAVPQGAAIFLSRALVKALRPHVESCERDTAKLCRNCGSQRLYMCVNWFTQHPRTLLTRGICRSPWKLEHRERWPFALTFHGFNRYRGAARSTDSLRNDMKQLWTLGKSQEEAVRKGLQASFYVKMQDVANMIACNGNGAYQGSMCRYSNGSVFEPQDGKNERASQRHKHGHHHHQKHQ